MVPAAAPRVVLLIAGAFAIAACKSSTEPGADDPCDEATCTPVTAAYISHFAELDCTGAEAYYTPYFAYDGIKRSWDGQGVAGTTLRTLTHKSWKMGAECFNEWPDGHTLDDFVRIYR